MNTMGRVPLVRRVFAIAAIACALAVLFAARRSAAQSPPPPLDPQRVPEPLKPWTAWVMDGDDRRACPDLLGHADISRCAWPSRLELALDEHGGRFSQAWRIDARTRVPLPGDDKRWPQGVQADGRPALVIARDGAPSVELAPGDHVVTGVFSWGSLPESLQIPRETALLSLHLRGVAVPFPNRDGAGVVWLQKAATNEEGEALEFVVHRKITDDIPAILETHIELHVAGKSREELLGRALPDSFVPMSLDSPLPARIEPDGHLRVQLRPGVFTLRLVARSEGPLRSLARPPPDGPWREGDEVWVFEAKNDYRVVAVGGVPSIDPQQTTLPQAWKRLPAYPMKVGAALTFDEKRRGDRDPPPDQLTLDRSLWLDFAGTGYTVKDRITGTLERDARLTMAPPTLLGRASVGGVDQFITHLAGDARTGIEVRQGRLNVEADSRIAGAAGDVPAVSWAHDFDHVTGTLHLPPGWRLFYASGVDDVPGTWVRGWSLLEVFLALIVAIGAGRLYGLRWGAVALVLLVATLPEDGAPTWSWLAVLAAEGLHRVLPPGKVKTLFGGARLAAIAIVTLIALPFLVEHLREAVYPALAHPETTLGAERAPLPVPEPGDTEKDVGADLLRDKAEEAAGGVAAQNAPPPPPPASQSPAAEPLLPQLNAVPRKRAPAPSASGPLGSASYRQSNAQVYDPAATVQTGPGLPRWQWTALPLRWSGPVAASQRLRLFLLSPDANLVLAALRATLLVLLILRVLPWTARRFPRGWAPPLAAAVAFLTVGLAPARARADLPGPELLKELHDRLVRKADCSPACASSPRMAIDVHGDVLGLRVELEAAAPTAVPLPGKAGQWTPSRVLLDGEPAKALSRAPDAGDGDDQELWLAVGAGRHQVVLEGPLPAADSLQLSLPLKPHRVEATAVGWTIAGLHEDGLADDDLQLTRVATRGGEAASLEAGVLPAFVRVERTLSVGLDWEVDTRVVRVTPPGAAVVLEVPLLAGERVTTADVRVAGGRALVHMGPQATELAWHSVLDQRSPVELTAPAGTAWVEVWRVDVGPIWDASYAGIPFVHATGAGGARVLEWRPWPGEKASVTLTRPEGVPGQTLTVDESTTELHPGLRATDVTLTLAIRASRGAEHTVTLPEGALLQSLSIDGAAQPIRQDGRRVTVPVVPGSQRIALGWREPVGIAPFFAGSPVDLGVPSVNATTTLEVPGGRWLILAGGPRVGPAVLFWSLLVVLFVASLIFGRTGWTPLRWWHWLLLGVGLSQVSVVAGAVFVGWLVALGWRSRDPAGRLSPLWFDLRQCGLAFWTVVALGVLAVSLYQGLLGAPEMQVRGNGSDAHTLRWFVDRSAASLPRVWIVSVPILLYRAAMLSWALWIALALLGWLRWGWSAMTAGGLWRRRPPAAPPSPPPAPAPPFAPPLAPPPAPAVPPVPPAPRTPPG